MKSWRKLYLECITGTILIISPGSRISTQEYRKLYDSKISNKGNFRSTLEVMLEHELCCVGFSWSSSPALTELEQLVMDWLVDCFGLPDIFKFSSKGAGGGCLQGYASKGKCTFDWY